LGNILLLLVSFCYATELLIVKVLILKITVFNVMYFVGGNVSF